MSLICLFVFLRYKRIDGSFSAFGDRDTSGSTWLTAFVVKCFSFARELQPTLVDKTVIDQAVNFLINQQTNDGSFREPGRVINQALQVPVVNYYCYFLFFACFAFSAM